MTPTTSQPPDSSPANPEELKSPKPPAQADQPEEKTPGVPQAEVPASPVPVPTAVHGLPAYQQPGESAVAVNLPSSIPTVQVDTALPQSAVNVTPQDPYVVDAPAILPKDLIPVPAPEPLQEPAPEQIPTSETHLAGQPPSAELPETQEQLNKLPES